VRKARKTRLRRNFPLNGTAPGPVTTERTTTRDDDGDGDGEGMTAVDATPTRDDLPDVTDFSDYGGGGDGDWGGGGTNEDDDFSPQQIASSSLRDHLMQQLALLNLPLRDRQVVAALIDALDDDGYLASSLDGDRRDVLEDDALEPEELTIGLKYVQSFEPAGVGARGPASASPCSSRRCRTTRPFLSEALKTVDGHLPLLAARDFTKLRRVLHCDEACVRGVRDLIRSLNPRRARRSRRTSELRHSRRRRAQGSATSGSRRSTRRRCPSFAPEPHLRRHPDAQPRVVEPAARGSAAGSEVAHPQRAAAVRDDPSRRVGDRRAQRRFFEHGEVAMRPMVLREIADMLDLHESTISRVTTQKYMLTPRGTFELKYFFGSHVATTPAALPPPPRYARSSSSSWPPRTRKPR
jgi:RNA polymerase sigma-54 factor